MSLADVMSHSGLVGFTEVALVVSFVAFLAIVVWVLLRPRDEMEAAARTPLSPDGTENEGRVADTAGKGMRA